TASRRPAAACGVIWRGLFGKKMKPICVAPPSRAAATASGVLSPHILISRTMVFRRINPGSTQVIPSIVDLFGDRMAVKTLCDQKIIRLHDLNGNSLRDLIAPGGIFQNALKIAGHLADKHFDRMICRWLVL